MALPKQSEDFPAWYQAVVKGAELAESSLVRGTMVIRPYGFAIWERIQAAVDQRIKATGHENVYFPLFIPAKLLEKEAEHVEGFAPEVAVVTHAGGEKLEEPVVVRPTSETIIWDTYSRWLQSYRDLPLLYNQWANVVRWELRPRVFLRTTEFLWQEGHTAHETSQEAMAEARMILADVYRATAEGELAMPVRLGRKSPAERFAGAVETFTMEGLMRDGRALQAGTSHYLGQNFAKAYDVKFLGREGREEYAWASSWGVSTRLVGALIMAHGDDAGLRLPPALAPIQVVIVPIYRDDDREMVLSAARTIEEGLKTAGVRVRLDDRDHRPGFKFNEWELKGVPVRVELGPRDLAGGQAVLYRRDLREKSTVPLGSLTERIPGLLDDIQAELFSQAAAFREARTFRPGSYAEMQALIADPGGFVEGYWCGSPACEAKVKAETKATIRTLTLDPEPVDGACIVCGEPATEWATWAQAY
ncbi:MAG TPA: proline--tRNA ligase [Actinomycetota bacterium]|nr:proline--tRNA ligase [Actinomycetota bacterium]